MNATLTFSTALALLFVAAYNAPAFAEKAPLNSFVFATSKIGNFEVSAETKINWSGDEPYISTISCSGNNGAVSFDIDSIGNFRRLFLNFRSIPGSSLERTIYTGDRFWLYVDNKRYEYALIGTGYTEFRNYAYRPVDSDGDNAIILQLTVAPSVKPTDGDAFMSLNRVSSEIVGAKKLAWSFKSRNWSDVDPSSPEDRLPEGWERRRYSIDNTKLSDAVRWCTLQVASPIARTLPSNSTTELRSEEKS